MQRDNGAGSVLRRIREHDQKEYTMMRSLSSKRVIVAKGVIFLGLAGMTATMLLLQSPLAQSGRDDRCSCMVIMPVLLLSLLRA